MAERADAADGSDVAVDMNDAKKRAGLTLGWKVFAGLAILSVAEYWFAAMASGPIPYPVMCGLLAPITWLAVLVSRNPLPFLVVAAIAKAILIVQYFMHVRKAWSSGGGH